MKPHTALLLVGAALAAPLSPVFGAEPVRFKDWTKGCEPAPDGGSNCHIAQNVSNPQTGQVVLRAEIGFNPDQDQPLMLVIVPLDVDLRPGLGFRIDSAAARRIDFFVCSRDGCRAALLVDAGLIAAMKRGANATVTVTTLDGRRHDVPLSLMGFTRGFDSLQP